MYAIFSTRGNNDCEKTVDGQSNVYDTWPRKTSWGIFNRCLDPMVGPYGWLLVIGWPLRLASSNWLGPMIGF